MRGTGWDHVTRMMIGGPMDNYLVDVQVNVDPYQVCIHEPISEIGTLADIIAADDPTVTSKVGRYWLDDFYDKVEGSDYQQHRYFRWEDMCRVNAAKIYMRRMGKSLYEIYNYVEWDAWQ